MDQKTRTARSRRMSEALGLSYTYILVPRELKDDVLTYCAELRADYFVKVANSNDKKLLKALASKRAAFNPSNRDSMTKLNRLVGDSREEAVQALSELYDVDEALSLVDNPFSDEAIKLSARRVALSHVLALLIGDIG